MSEPGRPRRPLHFGPDAMEAHGGTLPDPAETAAAAHAAAQTVVEAGPVSYTHLTLPTNREV